MDERTWSQRDAYARRSMAITRATGKAFRLGFSWIMTLAGYEPTPWEEMPAEITNPAPQQTQQKPAPKETKTKPDPKTGEIKAKRSWPGDLVSRMVGEGLANAPAHAVNILNQSPFVDDPALDYTAVIEWAQNRKALEGE
jgi:hypothetical protein